MADPLMADPPVADPPVARDRRRQGPFRPAQRGGVVPPDLPARRAGQVGDRFRGAVFLSATLPLG